MRKNEADVLPIPFHKSQEGSKEKGIAGKRQVLCLTK
jgi:hypothetical protein